MVPILQGLKRNDAGELTYSLNFYKYDNVDKGDSGDGDPGDRFVRRWTYGTWPAQTTDLLIDPLSRGGLDDGPEFTTLDFQMTDGDMINDKLNLEYLASEEVGLGEGDGYTVHVLGKEISYAGKSETFYAELLTDHDSGKTDKDYLAAGVWMLIPDSGEAEDFRTGVFADGWQSLWDWDHAGIEWGSEL